MTEPIHSFGHTHTAPAAGMVTWRDPGSAESGPRLDPYLPVRLVRVYGDWAQIVCANGWSAWVDGRALLPVSGGTQMPTAPTGGDVGRRAGGSRLIAPTAATLPVTIGAAIVVLSAFLPWVDLGGGSGAVNAIDVPLVFVFSWKNVADGGVGLGVVLIVLAVAAFALRHMGGAEKLAKIPAALCIPAVGAFIVQMNAFLDAIEDGGGSDAPSLLDVVEFGAWAALIGAGLLAWGTARR